VKRIVVAAVLASCGLSACQPVEVGSSATATETAVPGTGSTPGRGAPDRQTPTTFTGILDRAFQTALTWQDDPRPAEVLVELGAGRPAVAEVTYLAPEADRLLTVRITDEGIIERRPTLGALDLLPVSAAGMDELPPPPEGVLDPLALAAAAEQPLSDCGVDPGGGVVEVGYASGAPFAWDGQVWADPPVWTATVTVVESGGTRSGTPMDPITGTPAGDCFEVTL
jgi:hypothetical protein